MSGYHTANDVPQEIQDAIREAMRLEGVPSSWFDDLVWICANESTGHTGVKNSGSSASVAGPEAATPAIVKKIQLITTVFLWARTQRVSEDKVLPPAWFACER